MTRRMVSIGAAAVMLLVGAHVASAQTADEIVEKNLQAKGGLTKMRAMQTVKQTSHLSMQGMDATLTMIGKRPNLMRQEILIQGQTIVMVFDGTAPWMVNPMLGKTDPVVVTGPQSDMIREQSEFDGSPLINYKEKGGRLELIGTEEMNTAKVFHLKLTSKTGQVQHIYVDTTTYLDAKLVSESPMGMLEQELMDYRDVEGIKVPFHIRVKNNGVVQTEIKVDKVEFNVKVDDAMFKIPK
jgi:outer membrane lipoprotein-sorting protein